MVEKGEQRSSVGMEARHYDGAKLRDVAEGAALIRSARSKHGGDG
jgi:hypothetical protein